MTRTLPDVLFPTGIPAPDAHPTIRLPEPALRARVLDGDLAPIGWGYHPIDLPPTPALRAAAIAPRVPEALAPGQLVVAGRSAAWVWGAIPALETPLTIFIRPGGRMPAVDQPDAHLHGVELAAAEIVALGPLRVTSPVRTGIDLFREPAGRFELSAVEQLLREQRLELSEVHAALAARRRLPNRRLALARIQLLLTR